MVAADNNTMVVGLMNGKVAFTRNVLSGESSVWCEIAIPDLPQGAPANVAMDPTDTHTVVVAYNTTWGIDGRLAPTKHVFISKNVGTCESPDVPVPVPLWQDISGVPNGGASNLPDLPLLGVAIYETKWDGREFSATPGYENEPE